MSHKRKMLSCIKWGVSISLIVWILLRADLSDAITAVTKINILMVGVALLVMAFGLFVRSYKWQVLLKAQGIKIPLTTLYSFTYMSMFFNNFFLGSLGGDAFRFYKTLEYSDSKGDAASSVIMERATGFFMALLLVLVFGIVIVVAQSNLVSATTLVVLTVVAGIAGILMALLFTLDSFVIRFPVLCRIEQLTKIAAELTNSMRTYGNHRKSVIVALVLSGIFHVTHATTVYCLTLAANTEVSFIALLFIVPLVGVLVTIPISMNGLGIQEGSYVFYLQQLGVSSSAALLVAVLARLATLVFSLLGGLLFAMQSTRPTQTGSNHDRV